MSPFETATATSQDGTTIGYRRYGRGPAVVLVQGAMGYAAQYSELASALADAFTVLVPDRRGRATSPKPYDKSHVVDRDVEDLEAVLAASGAARVFGLSSGAIIALTAAAKASSPIRKLVAFEPPLYVDGAPRGLLAKFELANDDGDLATAFAAAGKAVQLVPVLRFIPTWLLASMMRRVFASELRSPAPSDGEYPRLVELAPSVRYDFRIVADAFDRIDVWRSITADVLLLGGSKSPAFLRNDLAALARVLPRAEKIVLPNLDHGASWNRHAQRNPRGNPTRVAEVLRTFFAQV